MYTESCLYKTKPLNIFCIKLTHWTQSCFIGLQLLMLLPRCAGITAVEGYHAGAIRTLLIQNGDVVTPYGPNVTTLIGDISAARNMLDGSKTTDDVGIYDAMTGEYILSPVNGNALAFTRTPQQVLDIVYLGTNKTSGGFFPNGLNGAIA